MVGPPPLKGLKVLEFGGLAPGTTSHPDSLIFKIHRPLTPLSIYQAPLQA